MKNLTALTLLLVLAACASLVRTRPTSPEDHAWVFLCYADQTYDCKGIEPPQVVRNDSLNNMFGSLGFYFPGDDMVFIRTDLESREEEIGVLIHEIAHYLQYQTRWSKGKHRCDVEQEAFRISDKYYTKVGRLDLVRGPTWHESYPRCTPYEE